MPKPGKFKEETASHSAAARAETQFFVKKTGKVTIPLTVKEILEEQSARKLA